MRGGFVRIMLTDLGPRAAIAAERECRVRPVIPLIAIAGQRCRTNTAASSVRTSHRRSHRRIRARCRCLYLLLPPSFSGGGFPASFSKLRWKSFGTLARKIAAESAIHGARLFVRQRAERRFEEISWRSVQGDVIAIKVSNGFDQ